MMVIENIVGRVIVFRGGRYLVEVDVIISLGFGRFVVLVDENFDFYIVEVYRVVSEVDEIIGLEFIGFDVME